MPQSVVEYGSRRIAIVGAVMLAALLQLADTTIVNVALPTINGNLGASSDEGAWFITAYIVANVIVIPLSPWLQARLGRRNYFAISIAGFTFFSLLCGLAQSVDQLILLRFIQGAFGGGLMVPAQQIIRDTYPPEKLGTSQSLFALGIIVGPTIGPTLGGFLTDDFSWRWVFFINLLPGIVAALLVMLYLRDPEKPKRIPVDGIGVALLAVGLGSMQYVFDEGERYGWFGDAGIVRFTVTAVLGLGAFVLWELFGTRSPAVALRVLRQRTVWAMSIANFTLGGAIYGLTFLMPLYTQQSLGFTTTLSGLLLMVRAGSMLVLYPVTNWITQRNDVDLRVVASLGIALVAVTTWAQAALFTTQTEFGALVLTQVLGGVGFAFVFVPLNVTLFRALDPPSVAPALALTRLAQQIGGSLGSAMTVTLLDRTFAVAQSSLRGAIAPDRVPVATFTAAHGSHALMALAAMVGQQAFALASADTTRTFALGSGVAVFLPFLFANPLRKNQPSAARPATRTTHIAPPHFGSRPGSKEALAPARR